MASKLRMGPAGRRAGLDVDRLVLFRGIGSDRTGAAGRNARDVVGGVKSTSGVAGARADTCRGGARRDHAHSHLVLKSFPLYIH